MAYRGLTPVVSMAFLLNSGLANAQCTTQTDANGVLKSARRVVMCNNKRLRRGPSATCTLYPAPPCSGTLVNDAMALAYGANNPAAAPIDTSALRQQYRCQKFIGKAVAAFIGKKLRYLIKGLTPADAEAKARRRLDKLPDRCAVTVALDAGGVILPDSGKQCDAAVGAPGTPVDASSLRDALVTLLDTWVDRVGPNPAPLRPNIVLILTDDQRFDTIGLEHSIDGVTPVMPNVLNELANHGVTFQNSYVTTALCAPSRASLLAAKYSHTTGVHDNGGTDGGFQAFNDTSTLAVWLKAAGYHTGLYGKYINGYGSSSPYTPPGWDEWHAFKNVAYFDYTLVENGVEVSFGSADADYSTDVLRDRAVQFIHDSAGPTPFFLYFAPKAPHGPATPAPRHAGSFSGIPPWRPPNYNEADVSDKPAWLQAIAPWTATQMANHDTFNQMQLECLQAVDEAVEALMQALRDTGTDRNTLIIFASDNGYSWGSHRWEPKQCPYEECMRVPLVIRYPALAPLPRVENGVGLNIDYGETIAELAGAIPDPGVEGRSMARLIDGTEPAWRTDFLEEHWDGRGIPTLAQVRGVPWKYTEYLTNENELYDETADPFELTNVVNDPGNAAVVTSLAARLRVLRPGWPSP
jgi:N-acetylglucosamine-6-sulfatase